ncbi:MAG: hypothetical protein M3R55_12265, partial [Acidobacteriota bacterium]|nr:hypothetical protein [Acidobacteriota bacterium]
MPSPGARRHLLVFLSYLLIAAAFVWPLPLQMSSALPGGPSGDTGVYVWNLWVFRHELVEHHRFPFFTLEILSATSAAPLVLHNYTSFANVLAFFVLPIFGVVATYNGLIVFSTALAAYALFLLARSRTGDDAASWVAGIAFGFSPFLMARAGAHFSLVQAAPLPIFALLLRRLYEGASWPTAAAAGAVVAWAYLCDPYYAVYCVLMLIFMIGYAIVTVRIPERKALFRSATWPLDLLILCLGGLIAGIMLQGGGNIEMMGLRVSMRTLYTPTLVLT